MVLRRMRASTRACLASEHEELFPLPLAQAYVNAASRAGDAVRLTLVPRVGHFDLASPTTASWPAVRSAIRALLDGRLPD